MADIHINEQQLKELTGRFTTLATSIGQVANGAYVTDTMFTTTRATSATAMDASLHVLVDAAQAMQRSAQGLADYLARVIVEFDQTDLKLAAAAQPHANRPTN
mgnify:CR=1 FL=1